MLFSYLYPLFCAAKVFCAGNGRGSKREIKRGEGGGVKKGDVFPVLWL